MPEPLTNKAALDAVRELHRRGDYEWSAWCEECEQLYPCRTIQAIEGER